MSPEVTHPQVAPEVGTHSVHVAILAAREAWERAGRPGDHPQLRLVAAAGRVPRCAVCEDRGCEYCPAVRP